MNRRNESNRLAQPARARRGRDSQSWWARSVLVTWMAVLVPSAGSAQEAPTVEDLSFLTGCWQGTMGSLDMREYWTETEGGMLMWTTRFFRDGEVVDWEFGLVYEGESGVTMLPFPRGSQSEHDFPLVRWDGEFVFENLAHDFPVRIIYVRDGETGLAPRIEGSDGESRGWALQRTVCPGAD
jgi:uncharacterized protein DUF6265